MSDSISSQSRRITKLTVLNAGSFDGTYVWYDDEYDEAAIELRDRIQEIAKEIGQLRGYDVPVITEIWSGITNG